MTKILILFLLASSNFLTYVITETQSYSQCQKEKDPYVQAVLTCLNEGALYFPEVDEAFLCSTISIGTLKGTKNENQVLPR